MRLDISVVSLWSQGVGNQLNMSLLVFSTYTERSQKRSLFSLMAEYGLGLRQYPCPCLGTRLRIAQEFLGIGISGLCPNLFDGLHGEFVHES